MWMLWKLTTLLSFALLLTSSVYTLPIYNHNKTIAFLSPEAIWTPSIVFSLGDTLQLHYESIVDRVVATHGEVLLSRLGRLSSTNHATITVLRHTMAQLGFDLEDIQLKCAKTLPRVIAERHHRITNDLYEAVEPLVFGSLDILVQTPGKKKSELDENIGRALHRIQKFVARELEKLMDIDFFFDDIRSDLQECQPISLEDETLHSKRPNTAEDWEYNPTAPSEWDYLQNHFDCVKADLIAEMNNNLPHLITRVVRQIEAEKAAEAEAEAKAEAEALASAGAGAGAESSARAER